MTIVISSPSEPYYAVHCEMQDASKLPTPWMSAAGAASIELAILLTELETVIDDERRARLIHFGGVLIRLDNEIDSLFPGRSRHHG